MEFVVLLKVVPSLDTLRYDRARYTVEREGGPLFLNPFDQRALRVALELRRPGEKVTAISLGPPAARSVLREARAVGADRVVLVSDPAFSGSDTLATARGLSAAIGRIPHDVVLAGAWTTDSGTGQVGPEVATLLGMPVLTHLRSLERAGEKVEFEATVDTPVGWASYRVPAPVLLTVGEKIVKPLKPDPEALAELPDSAVELWSLRDLSLSPDLVGARGSPTSVEAVTEVAPTRSPRVFAGGPIAERVAEGVAYLESRWARPDPAPDVIGSPPAHLAPDREVLVLSSGPDGRLDGSTLATLTEVRRALAGFWPSVVWVGREPDEASTFRLARAGALAGYSVRAGSQNVEPAFVVGAVEAILDRRPAANAAIFPASPFGQEVAGSVAARRNLGLVGDVVAFHAETDGSLRFSKPSFGDRTVATIRCRTRPQLATARSGLFRPPPGDGCEGGFGWTTVRAALPAPVNRRLSEGREVTPASDLEGRTVVVTVGMGVGGPETIARLQPILDRWGAGLAATRRVVDAGWVPRQLQVGLTGRALAPRLAVLLGVSGAANHMVGLRRAGTVVAVNPDPSAPVFREVDVGLVARVEEALPLLEAPVARLLRR